MIGRGLLIRILGIRVPYTVADGDSVREIKRMSPYKNYALNSQTARRREPCPGFQRYRWEESQPVRTGRPLGKSEKGEGRTVFPCAVQDTAVLP